MVYAHHFHTDEWPAYLGHLLVETKRHTPDFADLTAGESQAIGRLITRLSKALKACAGAEKVYVLHRLRYLELSASTRSAAHPATSSAPTAPSAGCPY
ncbi:hypothetical protein KSC_109230 [Ktedonobacter sp. SOSP1-52]|uniref:HIT family protein n=1 Tax=Ktedonobacter sp. SOSP1-52 TaxID=2778366 RepID=UPI001916B560|nr:hypothetical protein [Ktedonobacter sp. SOSP1-52]GHO72031.1 hypothetical protein KSC_109230 [Ktedonobacter sp. SOSP1-52]